MKKKEKWTNVVGYETTYKVSTRGRVKSISRLTRNRSGMCFKKGRILKQAPNKFGHTFVNLSQNGITKVHAVHRLVLQAFVGPCPKGMECRHFPDRNPSNNNLRNLRWGPRTKQYQDRKVHGTTIVGSKQTNSKLTERIVALCRIEHAERGTSCAKLARRYHVCAATMKLAVSGIQWKHVPHIDELKLGSVIHFGDNR